MAMLDRADLESALRELATLLLEEGMTGDIQIFGGAALALGSFDRGTTTDIDARLRFDADIVGVLRLIAARRGWQDDWLNDAGKGFIPLYGREVEWLTIFERDDEDIAQLLTICGVDSLGGAEEVFDAYYPGDCMSDRAIGMVEGILHAGLPARVEAPPAPRLAS
jgi:hypothetical protein